MSNTETQTVAQMLETTYVRTGTGKVAHIAYKNGGPTFCGLRAIGRVSGTPTKVCKSCRPVRKEG